MVKYADLLICDSLAIEKYINYDYKSYRPNTTYIAYGADIEKSVLKDDDGKLINWFDKYKIKKYNYYLVVGRFVPENNYTTIIKEFMASDTNKDLVIITNIEKNKFYNNLKKETNFDIDKRIKFVGTVYDKELLKKIRELAFAYIHGHEVGGTNPSLLEALASTKLNLLYDIEFNREVGKSSCFYWNKENGSLLNLIKNYDNMEFDNTNLIIGDPRQRIIQYYTWSIIIIKYEKIFIDM